MQNAGSINTDSLISQGIIEPEQLAQLIKERLQDLVILDASFVLPGSGLDPHQAYLDAHIEGARFFDIEDISDKNNPLPHMLPPVEQFEQAANALGIQNKSLIIIYGQSGMVMGPARAWWMFRYFGHDNVLVLNGGLPAWKKAGLDTSDRPFADIKAPSVYKARVQPQYLQNKLQVEQASRYQTARILDARPAPRFQGIDPEPRAGLRSGHIEGSINIPANSLIEPESGKLKSTNDLKNQLGQQGFDLTTDQPVITTCGSGVTACMTALALFRLGNKNVSVYDGSWAEWGIV